MSKEYTEDAEIMLGNLIHYKDWSTIKMQLKSIKKNFLYNFCLTFVNMLFPLITAPYLSSVLGAEGIGKVNYATTIINWFIIFAAFGVPRYGMREIAKNRNNKKKMSDIFWNLILLQVALTVVLVIIYFIGVFNLSHFSGDIMLYSIMSLMLILNIFSIDWFYQGIEEYGYITVRNVLVKLISIALIFFMIKKPEHYVFYAGINIFGLCFNNILNYFHSFKYINKKFEQFTPIYFLKHLKVFFLISLVVALYTQLDQLFLGTINERDLAYYMRSKTVLNVGLSLTTALVNVISPRAAYLVHNDKDQYHLMIQSIINYIYLLGLPITVGIFTLSNEIMYVLGGEEFLPASISLKIMAPMVLVNTIGSWVSGQILIPNKLEEKSFKIQCYSVIISIALNLMLIPKYSYIGATITWLIVESFLLVVKAIYASIKCKDITVNYINLSAVKYLISSLIMGAFIIFIQNTLNLSSIVVLTMIIVMSAALYSISLIILREAIIINLVREIYGRFRN